MTDLPSFDVAPGVPRRTGAIGIPLFRTSRGLKLALPGVPPVRVDLEYLDSRGFSAKRGESHAMPAGGRSAIAIGLGSPKDLDAQAFREAGAALVRAAKAARVTMAGLPTGRVAMPDAAQAFAEGAALAAYDFRAYKSGRGRQNGGPDRKVELITLLSRQKGAAASGFERGSSVAGAVAFARDLVNEPAGALPPRAFAELAVERFEDTNVTVDVWDEERIMSERLGGVLGVCAGSAEEPRFLTLSLNGALRSGRRPITLVGKGVTFDSGGLSLKTSGGMETMKTDMSGAAAVVATMSVLGELGVTLPVAGFVPLVENMPGGRATRPGDVLTIRNGKTVEVLNTDAEGRLILADALSLATELNPRAVVDLATLTGACTIALGDRIAGLMATDDRLAVRIESASARTGEPVWRLPLPDQYRTHIDSDIADLKNVGASGGQAGTLTAGLFLREFAGEGPWAHLDIAGPARSTVDDGYLRKGGTGFGVRLLVELLTSWR